MDEELSFEGIGGHNLRGWLELPLGSFLTTKSAPIVPHYQSFYSRVRSVLLGVSFAFNKLSYNHWQHFLRRERISEFHEG
jgi:hypothetical protein